MLPSCHLFNIYGMFVLTGIVMTASFRGRPLEGQKLPVPKGYVGELLFLT